MEERFGHDFRHVRIHADGEAAESARTVGARAYAVGNDIVFGHGEFAPNTSEGRRLLAHELGHVVEQSHGNVMLQKESNPPPARRNVVLLLDDGASLGAEANLLSAGGRIIEAESLDEIAAELGKIDYPIGTLYVISHSLSDGDIDVGNEFIPPARFSARLKGVVPAEYAPELVDFRGCSIGDSPEGMEQIRSALGADAATGVDGFMSTQAVGPVSIDGMAITQPEQLTDENRGAFRRGIEEELAKRGKAGQCVLDDSEEAYFRAGGLFVLQWVNPSFTREWQDGVSRCYKHMRPETVDPSKLPKEEDGRVPAMSLTSRLIRVEKKKPKEAE